METTDVASSDKLGVSASLVDWNIGGTKAFSQSRLWFNATYTSMRLYNALFPDRVDWTRPYRKLSGEAQYKAELSTASVLKAYVGYDQTSVGQQIDLRAMSFKERNLYANVTLKTSLGRGYSLFTGMALSWVSSNVDNDQIAGGQYHQVRNEVHLKTDIRKVYSPMLMLSAGLEDYIRHGSMRYEDHRYQIDYHLLAAHADAHWRIADPLFLNLSTRTEHLTYTHSWLLMPRATLSFIPASGGSSRSQPDDTVRWLRRIYCQKWEKPAASHRRPCHPQPAIQHAKDIAAHRTLLQEIPPSAAACQRHIYRRRIWHEPWSRRVSGESLAGQEPHHHPLILLLRR
jgi:hypothetical protein